MNRRFLILLFSISFFAGHIFAMTQAELDSAVTSGSLQIVLQAPKDHYNITWTKRLDYLNPFNPDPKQAERIQVTYLHTAIIQGNPHMVKALLDKAPDLINAGDSYGRRPLTYAMHYLTNASQSANFKEIVKVLFMPSLPYVVFDEGAENIGEGFMRDDIINAQLKDSFSDLLKNRGDTAKLGRLLKKLNFNKSPIFNNMSFLEWAAKKLIGEAQNNIKMDPFLEILTGDEARSIFLQFALCHAAHYKKLAFVKKFLQLGASPLYFDSNERSALNYAFMGIRASAPLLGSTSEASTINIKIVQELLNAVKGEEQRIEIINRAIDDLVNYNYKEYLSGYITGDAFSFSDDKVNHEERIYRQAWADTIEFIINSGHYNFILNHLQFDNFKFQLIALIKHGKININNIPVVLLTENEIARLNDEIIAKLNHERSLNERIRVLSSEELGVFNELQYLLNSGAIRLGIDGSTPFVKFSSFVNLTKEYIVPDPRIPNNSFRVYVKYDEIRRPIQCSIYFDVVNNINALIAKYPSSIGHDGAKFDITEGNTYIIKTNN